MKYYKAQPYKYVTHTVCVSNTIEMNEILKAKPDFIKTRKKRLSTEEIIDYINWALINDNMEMIKNNSLVFVQKSYKEQTGRDVSITFIRNQKIKMFKCNRA